MSLSLPLVLAVGALVGSILVMGEHRARTWAIIAAIVGVVELVVALKILQIQLRGYSLFLVLGVIVAACGIIMLLKVQTKSKIISATVVAVVGIVQVLVASKTIQLALS